MNRTVRRALALVAIATGFLAASTMVAAPSYATDLPQVEEDFVPVQTGSGEIEPSDEDADKGVDGQVPDDPTLDSTIGPAYYLYYRYTGEYGPCPPPYNYLGVYQGEYYVPYYTWWTSLGAVAWYQNAYKYTVRYNSTKTTYYDQRGFTTAYRYKGCYNGVPAYRYYGAYKVGRNMIRTQTCWSEGCNAGTWSYGPWRHGWWY